MATRGIGLSGLVTRGSHSEVKEPKNYVCEPYIQLLFSLEMSGPKTVVTSSPKSKIFHFTFNIYTYHYLVLY